MFLEKNERKKIVPCCASMDEYAHGARSAEAVASVSMDDDAHSARSAEAAASVSMDECAHNARSVEEAASVSMDDGAPGARNVVNSLRERQSVSAEDLMGACTLTNQQVPAPKVEMMPILTRSSSHNYNPHRTFHLMTHRAPSYM